MDSLKITVTGKVQGVWFRAKTKEKADALNLAGYVKNQSDGSVYIEVSGETEYVYKLVNWLQKGSELSKVDRVCIEKNTKMHSGEFVIER